MEYWKFNRFGRAVCPQTAARLLGDKQPYQMYRIILACVAMFIGINVFAAPYVTNVVAKQRYPWGIVDISCEVKGLEEKDKGLEFTIDAVSSNSGITNKVSHVQFRGVENNKDTEGLVAQTNGNYRFVWDANKDLGLAHYSNVIVRVSICEYHEKIQLWDDGPYWATTNIGAEKPEDYGYYFWWGDTIGYKRENDKWVASDESNLNYSFSYSNTPTYNKGISILQSEGWITEEGVLAPEHDAAQKHWGGDWRMPTQREFEDLTNKCDWVWCKTNGVNGYIVRGKGDYDSNSIFLPVAGRGNGYDNTLNGLGSYGHYWSSVSELGSSSHTWMFAIDSDRYRIPSQARYYGLSVRPLQGFTK